MMTRRTLLRLAAAAAGGAALGACDGRTVALPRPGDQLFVRTGEGLSVLDATTGRVTMRPGPSVVTGDWTRLVRTEWTEAGTRLATHRLPYGEVVAGGTLRDRLDARVMSADGRLVALASPAGTPSATYRPGPRSRTTIVVADTSGERVRLDLSGNLEPEAFDSSGQFLFVLDYLPPTAPDRYRVRAIDLTSGTPQPLVTRAKAVVPPGAEEEMRGEGRQAVHDPVRRQLFTLYTHQPDHLHTRELVNGARDAAPHVHAFVHTLHLTERWAYCIDLPAPFGERDAAGHAIALSANGTRLCVVDTTSGAVALIDPAGLNVVSTRTLPAPTGSGAAAAALTDDGSRLVVGAGDKVVVMPFDGAPSRWSAATDVRGLALAGDQRVYVGQDGAVTGHDLTTGRLLSRTPVPGLVELRHATPQR